MAQTNLFDDWRGLYGIRLQVESNPFIPDDPLWVVLHQANQPGSWHEQTRLTWPVLGTEVLPDALKAVGEAYLWGDSPLDPLLAVTRSRKAAAKLANQLRKRGVR